jgi:hypothetical protein
MTTDNVIDINKRAKLAKHRKSLVELLDMEKSVVSAIKFLRPFAKFNDIKNLIISLEDVRINIRRAINTKQEHIKRLESNE